MKKQTVSPTERRQLTVLRQFVELIPGHLVAQLARRTGAAAMVRSFSAWSHVVALLYAQLAHAESLNDVCDALRLWRTPLAAIRGATPPSRNNLSHANRERPCAMAEQLFWAVLGHLEVTCPGFGRGAGGRAVWRFRRAIHIVDSTTIQLVASCLDWARHRRRKAAAKCHLRLSLRSLLPGFVIVDTARDADSRRAREMCAGLHEGEIVLFDKAYVDFAHLWDLAQRGVNFVTRAREDLVFRVVRKTARRSDPRILSDTRIKLTSRDSRKLFPGVLRRVVARVELDGQVCELVFLTNQLEWSAASVADLYRCRWQIEVFFKQIKQTLQLADFLGHNANAVKWQVWMALLVYVLLRFQAWRSRWAHSFSRLLTLCRAALWMHRDLGELLRHYGTADGDFHHLERPHQRPLPGFEAQFMGQHG